MDIWTWRLVGVAAIATTVFAYRASWPESPMAATVGFFVWSIFAISATNVTESAGACCTYQYSYQGLMYIGFIGAGVSLLAAFNGVLEGFGAPGIRDRVNAYIDKRGTER
jgi:hypothetical protein